MADKQQQREEALRLKTLAESKFNSSSLTSALKYAIRAHNICPSLPGLAEMLAAFRILNSSKSELYEVLGLEPFSPLSAIKAQFKKLALLLHPDKSTLKSASEEAFKIVNDAFQVLSDRVRRKEYDTKLRIAIQEREEGEEEEEERESGSVEDAFWTVCSRCRMMHKFDRMYVGQSLVCPSCNRSFRAVEVAHGDDRDNGDDNVRSSMVRVRDGKGGNGSESENLELGCGNGIKGREGLRRGDKRENLGVKSVSKRKTNDLKKGEVPIDEGRTKKGSEKARNDNRKKGGSRIDQVDTDDEELTLAEMRLRTDERESTSTEMTDEDDELTLAEMRLKTANGELTLSEMRLEALRKKKKGKKDGDKKLTTRDESELEKTGKKESGKKLRMREESESELEKTGRRRLLEAADMEVMPVEDSDFYDFDKDRVEKSFKKGQIWAIYDDDDGMPRHYGLIDEFVSANPFEVKMSWLDLHNSGNEQLISLEKLGFHVSCGRFKVAKKDTIKLLNIFSHMVHCERAARELYIIYPRKGSIWALYNERELGTEGRASSSRDRRTYDIVVALTSYSDLHGLSMAYLEKVEGYRAVFKRREIGYRAVRWLEKDDIRLFSHQIPARKLSSDDAPDLSGDCWELDPASLPPDLLTISSQK